jgi:predicted transcriptional regulator
VSAFERWVYTEVTQHYRRTRQPVRTVILADLAGKNDRIVRGVLCRLEQAGAVQRRGQRGGWLPAA